MVPCAKAKIVTEVKRVPSGYERMPSPELDQFHVKDPKAYEMLWKKSGRAKFLDDAFKPVIVTACQKGDGGSVRGFV